MSGSCLEGIWMVSEWPDGVPSGPNAKCDRVSIELSANHDWLPGGPITKYDQVPSAKCDRVPILTECQMWPSTKCDWEKSMI